MIRSGSDIGEPLNDHREAGAEADEDAHDQQGDKRADQPPDAREDRGEKRDDLLEAERVAEAGVEGLEQRHRDRAIRVGHDGAEDALEREGIAVGARDQADEIARELAYRLYTVCERKKRAAEALAYNGLVQSWPEIIRLAREGGGPKVEQRGLFGETEE